MQGRYKVYMRINKQPGHMIECDAASTVSQRSAYFPFAVFLPAQRYCQPLVENWKQIVFLDLQDSFYSEIHSNIFAV